MMRHAVLPEARYIRAKRRLRVSRSRCCDMPLLLIAASDSHCLYASLFDDADTLYDITMLI